MEVPITLDKKTEQVMLYAGLLFCMCSALCLVLISKGYLPSDSFTSWAYYFSLPVLIVTGFIMAFWRPPTYRKNFAYLVVFHILSVLVAIFVAGIQPIFLLVWLLLLIATDTYLGRRFAFISFGLLIASATVWIVLHPGLTDSERFGALTQVVLIGAIGYVVSRIRQVSAIRDTELEVSREQERIERERLLALINSMGDAVIATNEKGAIRIYNGAALSLLDTNESLLGKPINEVLNLQDLHKQPVDLVAIMQEVTSSTSRSDLKHTFKDGDMISLYINVAPIHLGYQHSGERGFIFLLRDITKEKSLEEERDEFISVVSHELRTPIAIAEGNISNAILLRDHNVDPQLVSSALKDAHDQVVFLSKMANDLATLSRAERGKQNLEIEEVSVADIMHDIQENYQPEADKRKLQLITQVIGDIPPFPTSKLYVQEILQNFVTNALKYTKEGSVTVTAQQLPNHHVVFKITDTGIGISKADQKHLFEKFFRSEDYRTRESSGTGLGLYLVQKLASQIHAQISIESRLNFGSTFSIEVAPLAAESE